MSLLLFYRWVDTGFIHSTQKRVTTALSKYLALSRDERLFAHKNTSVIYEMKLDLGLTV